MRWAILNDNIVVEIKDSLSGNELSFTKLHKNVPCSLGWTFFNGEFIAPKWTSYQFLLRLTSQERADIRERSKTDPNIADFLMLAQSAQEVISNDPVTLMGMNYLVSIGVFTEQRKKEILQILE